MLKELVILKKNQPAQITENIQRGFDESINSQRWYEGSRFALQLVEQTPNDSLIWLRAAPVLVMADNSATYSDFCQRMVTQFADSKLPDDSERVIKACLVRPDSIDIALLPLDQLSRMLDDGTGPDWFPPWGWGTLAISAYRRGNAESAIQHAMKSEELNPHDFAHAMNLLVLAMARHQLKQPEKARKALDEASQVINRLQANENTKVHSDTLIAQILFREAESLINGKPKP